MSGVLGDTGRLLGVAGHLANARGHFLDGAAATVFTFVDICSLAAAMVFMLAVISSAAEATLTDRAVVSSAPQVSRAEVHDICVLDSAMVSVWPAICATIFCSFSGEGVEPAGQLADLVLGLHFETLGEIALSLGDVLEHLGRSPDRTRDPRRRRTRALPSPALRKER